MGSPVGLDPKLCHLGLLPDADIDKYLAIFIQEALFLARKTIAKVWIQAMSPTFHNWKREINGVFPYRKMIYANRGRPQKFSNI